MQNNKTTPVSGVSSPPTMNFQKMKVMKRVIIRLLDNSSSKKVSEF